MKKFFKWLGIISGILAALGIVFVSVGLIRGGKEIVKSDLLNNRLAVQFDQWFDEEDENMSSISNGSIMKIDQQQYGIHSLTVRAKYGDINIKQWNETGFGIENKAKRLDVKYEVVDGVLNISVSGKFGITNNSGKINIYIPNEQLSSTELFVGAGELECNGMTADNLKIEVGVGEGKIDYSQFGQCDIDVGVGELDIENTTVNSMNVDCGMGEVKAELNNSYNDFDYTLKVGAGEIELGTQKYEGISNSINLSNQTGRTMDIDCGMGEVSIKFNQM